jgi:hypothetical protein
MWNVRICACVQFFDTNGDVLANVDYTQFVTHPLKFRLKTVHILEEAAEDFLVRLQHMGLQPQASVVEWRADADLLVMISAFANCFWVRVRDQLEQESDEEASDANTDDDYEAQASRIYYHY